MDTATSGFMQWALRLASQDGHIDVVGLLIENGADIEVADKGGLTPLHEASCNGHIDVVGLLENGADVAVVNKDGWTPLHRAS